jgi:hypothetical protein
MPQALSVPIATIAAAMSDNRDDFDMTMTDPQ